MSNKNQIKAITFDLWDTVIIDDSDEPKRAAQNLLSKPLQRRRLVYEYLRRHQSTTPEQVNLAYDTVDAAFRQVWYEQNVTWTVAQRLRVLLQGLQRELPPAEFNELISLHEDMELTVRPDLAPGIADALAALHEKCRLGVISDAIFSPGRALRELLKGYDILKYFDVFIFSDEIGRAKPEPVVFTAAAQNLGVELSEIVHIGDREPKDIAGPHAVGARAIFTTVVKDRGSENTKADAVCHDYNDLVSIIDDIQR
jgi:HAD superfamily hydrolase (TIGR01549 family)